MTSKKIAVILSSILWFFLHNFLQLEAFEDGGRTGKKVIYTKDQSVSEVMNRVMKSYNKQEPPSLSNATEVQLGVYIISFYSINEQTMDYSVSMYLRQTWKDPRMSLNASNDVKELRLGDSRYKEIWLPDTFLRNEKAANFHLVTVENRMLKLTPAGTLWYVTKITATLACPMNLEKFPMDTQVCPMLFESFGYTYETMYFRMLQHNESIAIDISRDLQLPQFFIKNSSVINCDQNYTTGLYPCLEFKFILKRDIGYFLIQVYVPSILIVILSWVSFWINVDASPARVSIGLLTVLTTTTMSSGARATLPRVSYIKAIDVWMIICLLFVFLSLIEYAVVNVTARRTVRPQPPPSFPKPPRRLPPIPANQTRDLESGLPVSPGQRKPKKALNCFKKHAGRSPRNTPKPQHDGKYQARQLDKIARKIFPITFILFNCIYWSFYSLSSIFE